MFKESIADAPRWVLHVPLQQPWTDTSRSVSSIHQSFQQIFSKLFLKQVVSAVWHHLIQTIPTWYHYLFTMPFHTNTNRTDRTKRACTYACTHTYTSVRHKGTNISNRNQERKCMRILQVQTHKAPPERAERLQCMQTHCYTYSHTEHGSQAHTPAR